MSKGKYLYFPFERRTQRNFLTENSVTFLKSALYLAQSGARVCHEGKLRGRKEEVAYDSSDFYWTYRPKTETVFCENQKF